MTNIFIRCLQILAIEVEHIDIKCNFQDSLIAGLISFIKPSKKYVLSFDSIQSSVKAYLSHQKQHCHAYP